MEEKFGMQKSQEALYTPLYKVFLLVSLFTSIVFGCFLVLIENRNEELSIAYKTLEQEGQKSFSTLTGYHMVVSENHKRHIYTYLVTDEFGKLHEMTEFVDDKSHLRLRVGNTIITRQKKIKLAGKEKILSRIEGNNQILPNFNYLEKIAGFGFGYSILIGFGGLFLLVFKRDLA